MSFGYTVGVSNRFAILLDDNSVGVREVEKPKKQTEKKAADDKKPAPKTEKKTEQPKSATQKDANKPDEKQNQGKVASEKPKGPRSENNRGPREGRPRDGEQREARPEGARGGRGRGGDNRGPREPREGQQGEARGEGRGRGRGEGRTDRGPRDYRADRPPRDRPQGPRNDQVAGDDSNAVAGAGAGAGAGASEERRPDHRIRKDRRWDNKEEQVSEEKGFVKPKERLYERKSGTGRAPNEFKKRGAGRGNWGKEGSEIEGEEEPAAEAGETPNAESQPKEQEKEPAVSAEEAAKAEEARKKQEEEEKHISFEEHLKIQQSNLADVPLRKPLRKAGEGDDDQKWADFSPLKKSDDSESKALGKKKEKKLNPKSQKVPVDQILDVRINADSPSRQQRNRNPKRKPEQQQPVVVKKEDSPTPVLNDDKLFPSLSPVVKA